jgi:hypothetical protein
VIATLFIFIEAAKDAEKREKFLLFPFAYFRVFRG